MNITLTGAKVVLDTHTLAFQKNNLVNEIVVTVDTDESWAYRLDVKYSKEDCSGTPLYNIINLDRQGDTLSVVLTMDMLPFNGKYTMQFRGVDSDGKVYHSDIFDVWVKYSIEAPDKYDPVPSEFYQIEENITEANQHPPKPGSNGYWLVWNTTTKQYEESDIALPEGTLPDISAATNGWYLTNDGDKVYWAEVQGGGGDSKIDAIEVNGVEQPIVNKTAQLTVDKTTVGLGNVDDTSDADKPVSTAQANAIAQVQENLDQLFSNLADGTTKVKAAEAADSVEWTGVKNAPAIPTKTSELDNDSGYITDAALDDYAKTADIPTKVSQLDNDANYITAEQAPVQSVNGQTGAVTIDVPDPYTLPVASADTLGGVKPDAKTDDMLTPVGVDTDGKLWVAATDIDTIPADKVMFTSDLVFTYQFGKYTPTGGKVTVPADNTSLLDVLNDAFSEDKLPTITQPTVSVSSTIAKAYEVGTSVTPQYSATFNAGKYEYGPNPTGAAITAWAASNNVTAETKSAQIGSFAAYVVPDGSAYRITVRGTYSDGQVPITALEKPYPTGQIKGATKSAQTGIISGYRNSFYGTLTDKSTEINSTTIRGLTQKSGKALANGNSFTVNIPVGAQVVLIAYPATLRNVTSIKDVNGLNADITSAFTSSTVDVEGAAGYTAISYKVYRLDFAKPNDAANKYTVTI